MLWSSRWTEQLSYSCICFMLVFKFSGISDVAAYALHDISMLLIVAGVIAQGLRYAQIPMIVAFLATQLGYGSQKMDHLEMILCGTAISLVLYFCYGGFDFRRVETTGPYDVGYRSFTAKEFQNECAVFYPVDKSTPAQTSQHVFYLRFGNCYDSMVEIQNWLNECNKLYSPPIERYLIRPYGFLTLPVKNQATLAKEFLEGTKKLQPLIFSHGLG